MSGSSGGHIGVQVILWLVNWPEYWSVIGAGEVPQHHHHPAQRPGQPAEGLGVRAAGALAPQHQDIAQGRRQAAAGNKLACLGLNPPGDCTSPVQCRGSNRTSSAPSRTSSSTRQARWCGHRAQSDTHLRGQQGGRGWQYDNVAAI